MHVNDDKINLFYETFGIFIALKFVRSHNFFIQFFDIISFMK